MQSCTVENSWGGIPCQVENGIDFKGYAQYILLCLHTSTKGLSEFFLHQPLDNWEINYFGENNIG
jgi:hypothetical protein